MISKNNQYVSFSYSSFVANASLIVSPAPIVVSSPLLSAKQNENVDVISVNETFNLSTIIVDKISKKKIGNIQWSTWSASASLYTDVQYQSNGTLLSTSSSRVIVDTTAGTITVVNLAINQPGMYIVKLQIISLDNVYSILLTSNAILVKKNTSELRSAKT